MQSSNQDIRSLSYEQAFAELEEIVYGLEANQKTLDEALTLFERGQALAKYCSSLLDQAELKVQQLSGQDTERNTFTNEEEF